MTRTQRERIRELEAELWNEKLERASETLQHARAKKLLLEAEARGEELEAEVAGLRTSHAISEARNQREHTRAERAEAALKVAQSQYGVAYENLARAERAEWRVKELERWGIEDELRGEDRG